MLTLTARNLAADKLARGDVDGFLDAMLKLDAAAYHEIAGIGPPSDPATRAILAGLVKLRNAAAYCRSEYERRLRAMHVELARDLMAAPDPDVREIGAALAADDYSRLAI